MKKLYELVKMKAGYSFSILFLAALISMNGQKASAQGCPASSIATSITALPNTFFPANQAVVSAGSSSINLGAATVGATPISSGDMLLIIQMQGAQINSNNTSNYGSGTGTGSGYLNNSNLMAGNMEYVIASNNVAITGGTLNTVSPLTNSYQNTPFGTDGQYTYQVIRVPVYYDLVLGAAITAPRWNGTTGGVVVLYATHNINLNTWSIDASGLGFRGGGGRAFNGSGSGSSSDFITNSTMNANGGKGEGIAGTPKYLNDNNSFLDVSATEGYPNGSYGKGAPANGGGGGTDGNPASSNDENTGGGGGGNAGAGGGGGNAWSSGTTSGGRSGAIFAQVSASRLVMGGGGGSGTTNNGTGTPNNGFASSGAAGGGIILLTAGNQVTGTGTVKANGVQGNSTVKNDGSGGGGAGGSIVILSPNGGTSNITAQAKGGNGGSNQTTGGEAHGPGGGGGGGYIYSNSSLNAASTVAGGSAGTTSGLSTNYGATAGTAGVKVTTMSPLAPAVVPIHCVVLGLSFIDVMAAQNNGAVSVNWQVSREIDTREYIVEKSTDGVNFSAIGSVPFQSVNSDKNNYAYPDNTNNNSSIVYYRIKEVEVSGNEVYSKIVSVRINGLTSPFSVYPNPASTMATVSFTVSSPASISLRLFDLAGSLLWQQQYRAGNGQNTVRIDRIGTLPNGVYILQWFDGLNPQQVKLMVNH